MYDSPFVCYIDFVCFDVLKYIFAGNGTGLILNQIEFSIDFAIAIPHSHITWYSQYCPVTAFRLQCIPPQPIVQPNCIYLDSREIDWLMRDTFKYYVNLLTLGYNVQAFSDSATNSLGYIHAPLSAPDDWNV